MFHVAATKPSTRTVGRTSPFFLITVLRNFSGRIRARSGGVRRGKPDGMAGCRSGRLDYLVISEGGLGGVGETLRRVPWTGCRVEEGVVKASFGASRLARLEQIEPDHWPAR